MFGNKVCVYKLIMMTIGIRLCNYFIDQCAGGGVMGG
jgi:hypothetical protein